MLRPVGKYRIPSVKFHRLVRVYLRSVKFYRVLVQRCVVFEYRIHPLKDEKSDAFSDLENFRRNMQNVLI